VVSILLGNDYAHDIRYHPKSTQLHGLAMKMDMLEDEMSLCKVMMLYLAEGRSLELIENIFRSSKTKGRVIYNTMISVYGKHFAENAHQLFLEMVNNRIRLSGHTFKYHLEAWTIACKPQRTLEFLHFMILFFIKVYFPCIIIVLTPKHNFEK